jgi:hypothetical protein
MIIRKMLIEYRVDWVCGLGIKAFLRRSGVSGLEKPYKPHMGKSGSFFCSKINEIWNLNILAKY